MGRVKDLLISLQERAGEVECPVCDGEGLETVEVAKPQSFSRDVGEIYEELHHCERCDGSGYIEVEEEDE